MSCVKVNICLCKKYMEQKKMYPKELLYGLPPRNGCSEKQLFRQILKKNIHDSAL